jgi:hypothetical protein
MTLKIAYFTNPVVTPTLSVNSFLQLVHVANHLSPLMLKLQYPNRITRGVVVADVAVLDEGTASLISAIF